MALQIQHVQLLFVAVVKLYYGPPPGPPPHPHPRPNILISNFEDKCRQVFPSVLLTLDGTFRPARHKIRDAGEKSSTPLPQPEP